MLNISNSVLEVVGRSSLFRWCSYDLSFSCLTGVDECEGGNDSSKGLLASNDSRPWSNDSQSLL